MKTLFHVFLQGEKMCIVSRGTPFKSTPQGRRHELKSGLILRGCPAKVCWILIILIAQVVVISVCHCYLADCKPTRGWQRAQ